MLSSVLIIDNRKELSVKYKKAVEDVETSVNIANTLDDAINLIRISDPELIIVSDSIKEHLEVFCERIRSLTYDTRPVIVAMSKSADANDRIKVLDSGADDFWSEPVDINEFKTRIKAHLRREIESNLDNKTLLPNKKITLKSLKRVINLKSDKAVLSISIDNFDEYKSVYSDIAGDKLIQAFSAIVASAIESDDFYGQIDDKSFIIITSSYRAEKLAAYLKFAFDTIVPKFYNKIDVKRGYMLVKGDRLAGMRVGFVSLQIGCILGGYDLIEDVNVLLGRLAALRKIAKIPEGSNYIIDRIKLTGSRTECNDTTNGKIYVNESDESLALLIRTTLELQGYDVADFIDEESATQPSVLIIDGGDNLEKLNFCRKIKKMAKFANSKIIVTTSLHDKTAVLNAGADLYLPKPYELTDLVRWVEYFFKAKI